MCGFVGLVGTNTEGAKPMLDSIRSRGPDDVTFIESPGFGLGFCRLSIVAREDGRQPVSIDGINLAFNGEIYNYRQLQRRLQEEHSVDVCSEAQALLRLYQLLGPSFVSELDGDFAILVLDSRTHTCYAFRDFLGVKPLYYASANHGSTWMISSHPTAFFHYPGFSTEIDHVALAEKRVLNLWSSDRTAFASIHQVRPGHFLELPFAGNGGRAGKPEITAYRPRAFERANGSGRDAQDIDGRCTDVVRRALSKRIHHSEVTPIVLALSGGIDSSFLAAIAAAEWPERLATVTIHDGVEREDLECGTELARALGLTHHAYEISTRHFLDEFPNMVLQCAGPNPSYTPYFLGRAVKEHYPDAKVVLCGEGADEFFIGYTLLLEYRDFVARSMTALKEQPAGCIAASPLLQRAELWNAMAPDDIWHDLVRMFQQDQLLNLHLLPFDHGLMAHSLECRVPYLDDEVVDDVERIPAQQRVLDGHTKILLRVALAEALQHTPELARRILGRRPSPAFFSTLEPRKRLRGYLDENLPGSRLAQSELAPYARDRESLFWLGSLESVFIRHRGEIDGLRFEELAQEVLHGG